MGLLEGTVGDGLVLTEGFALTDGLGRLLLLAEGDGVTVELGVSIVNKYLHVCSFPSPPVAVIVTS